MATPNYDINEEEVKKGIDAEMNTELDASNKLYDDQIATNTQKETDLLNQIGVRDENGNWNEGSWADIQTDIQNEQTEFAIEKIEQQKEQANKDYLKEQSASYVDWQKQSNQYGANAEKMASGGLTNTGYSESSQVNMYNSYQNRVAVARLAHEQAKLELNNAITEAKLQNSAALAQIALNAYEKSWEITMSFLAQNQSLLTEKTKAAVTIKQNYWDRYKDTLAAIQAENELKEKAREYDASLAEEQRQFNKTFEAQYGGGAKITSGGGSSGGKSTTSAYKEAQSEKIAQKNNKNLSSKSKKTQIKTKYYSGDIADNVGGFGYMGKDKNGVAYQPKGVMINGKAYKLKKVGMAHQIFGKDAVNSSGVSIVGQNVWMANGQTFIWNGSKNRYERVS